MSFLLAWLGSMFPLVFSPGPANIMLIAAGANQGFRRTLPFLLGINLIYVLKSILLGAGIATIVQNYPVILRYLQLMGAVYLLYLAYGFFIKNARDTNSVHKAVGFWDGVALQTFNAKGWVIVILMFTLFSDQASSLFGTAGVSVLIAMLAVLNIITHAVWASSGAVLIRMLNKSNNRLRSLLFPTSLVMVALWLILDNVLVE